MMARQMISDPGSVPWLCGALVIGAVFFWWIGRGRGR